MRGRVDTSEKRFAARSDAFASPRCGAPGSEPPRHSRSNAANGTRSLSERACVRQFRAKAVGGLKLMKPNVFRKGRQFFDRSTFPRLTGASAHSITRARMSESYQHVVKGGLKLKGGVPAAGGVKKKKKKKDKHKDVRGDARFRPVHDAHHRTFRAFHRALARLGLTSRLPSSATFAERERRRGAGRRGRRGRVRPSARGGHAHGGGAAVRRAGCEDPGKADSLDGEQVAPRQGEGLQRVPLQAQRAPRHSQGRTRMMTDVVFERKGETFSTTRRTRAQKRSEKRRRRRRARRALLCFPPSVS